jgi:hypothetical protein
MRRQSILALPLAAALLGLLSACGPAPVPDPTWASIRDDVFIPSCGCHTGDAPRADVGLDGDTPADLLDVDASSSFSGWKYIVAGSPEESLVYVRLTGGDGEVSAMPPSSSGLDSEVTAVIAEWITAGASD